jgi:membrane-associated phospholipid phosphatase
MLHFTETGIEWVLAVQSLGPWLQLPMSLASFMGSIPFYLLIMPVVLWCYDYSLGFRLGLILSASGLFNVMLKWAFSAPRPFWVSTKVQPLSFEPTFGMPSGHAQNGVSLWGRLARGLNRSWAYWTAAALVLVISFSRLYLGVHFPLDVMSGWIAGAALLAAFLLLEQPLWIWFQKRRVGTQLLMILASVFGVLGLGILVWNVTTMRQLPPQWAAQAAAVAEAFNDISQPQSLDDLLSVSGILLGFGVGGWLLYRRGMVSAKGPLLNRAARYAIGAFGVALIYFGLGQLEWFQHGLSGHSWRIFRYAVAGFWIAYAAPLSFATLGLAEREPPPQAG